MPMQPSPIRETSRPASEMCSMRAKLRRSAPGGEVMQLTERSSILGPADTASRGELGAMNDHRPAAVLFDMDGTLVDSEKVWSIALFELARRAGGELSPAARHAMVGNNMANSMRI